GGAGARPSQSSWRATDRSRGSFPGGIGRSAAARGRSHPARQHESRGHSQGSGALRSARAAYPPGVLRGNQSGECARVRRDWRRLHFGGRVNPFGASGGYEHANDASLSRQSAFNNQLNAFVLSCVLCGEKQNQPRRYTKEAAKCHEYRRFHRSTQILSLLLQWRRSIQDVAGSIRRRRRGTGGHRESHTYWRTPPENHHSKSPGKKASTSADYLPYSL